MLPQLPRSPFHPALTPFIQATLHSALCTLISIRVRVQGAESVCRGATVGLWDDKPERPFGKGIAQHSTDPVTGARSRDFGKKCSELSSFPL
jgi:hypothetical protein